MESGHQQWAPVLGERAFPAFAWIPAANADVRATPQARANGAGTCNKTSLSLGYFSGAGGPHINSPFADQQACDDLTLQDIASNA